MNGRILRRKGESWSVIEMDQVERDRIARLGHAAQRILTTRYLDLWQKADGPEILAQLVGGTLILQRIGQPTQDAIIIRDDGAHLAFMACVALALAPTQLDAGQLLDLALSLKFLALCCPVEVTVQTLPPYETLPEPFRTAKAIRRQYHDFEETPKGPRIVMLSDAYALLCIFEKARRPEDAVALAELTEVARGLRTALQRVQDAAAR